jgi:hypothetical protein
MQLSDSELPGLTQRSNTAMERPSITQKNRCTQREGDCWDVRLDFVRQFKTDYVRRLECLVFEEKKSIIRLG